MKVIEVDDLVIGKSYFFVYDGVVYHGECTSNSEEPETFEVNTHMCCDYICDVHHASLIYLL